MHSRLKVAGMLASVLDTTKVPLATAVNHDDGYNYGAGVDLNKITVPDGKEDTPILSPKRAEEYMNRREQLRQAATKMARDAEATERALARFRKFDITEKGIALALAYVSSMMPKHYELSTDGVVRSQELPSRYGMSKRMEYVIEDLKSGFSSSHPFTIIENMICIPSNHPRWIKGAFEFQLKQHLDYELRFRKRDENRYNIIFAKKV